MLQEMLSLGGSKRPDSEIFQSIHRHLPLGSVGTGFTQSWHRLFGVLLDNMHSALLSAMYFVSEEEGVGEKNSFIVGFLRADL